MWTRGGGDNESQVGDGEAGVTAKETRGAAEGPEKRRKCQRKYRAAHLEKIRERDREGRRGRRATNPKKMREADRKYYATHREEHRKYDRERLYGLAAKEYEAMTVNQGGRCAICRRGDVRLGVDHDHLTGVVRGLLCNGCNAGMGGLQDSPDLLQRAIQYLVERQP
jgi:hypothetical protein